MLGSTHRHTSPSHKVMAYLLIEHGPGYLSGLSFLLDGVGPGAALFLGVEGGWRVEKFFY